MIGLPTRCVGGFSNVTAVVKEDFDEDSIPLLPIRFS